MPFVFPVCMQTSLSGFPGTFQFNMRFCNNDICVCSLLIRPRTSKLLLDVACWGPGGIHCWSLPASLRHVSSKPDNLFKVVHALALHPLQAASNLVLCCASLQVSNKDGAAVSNRALLTVRRVGRVQQALAGGSPPPADIGDADFTTPGATAAVSHWHCDSCTHASLVYLLFHLQDTAGERGVRSAYV